MYLFVHPIESIELVDIIDNNEDELLILKVDDTLNTLAIDVIDNRLIIENIENIDNIAKMEQ
jgi:hypothetical protein